MLKGSREQEQTGGNIITVSDNEINNDDTVEDVECVQRRCGSNSFIPIQEGSPGHVLLKGSGIIPLHLAASQRRVKSMQTLLSARADPEMRDWQGRTTLHLLIICWPRIQISLPKSGSKLLTAKINSCSQAEACLQLLCEHGVDINAQVERQSHQTALHLAVRFTVPTAVHILASYGANVNAVDSSGMTPLHMAAGMLHKDLIGSMIKAGADINMQVKHSGNTPLHLAAAAVAMKTTKTLEDDMSCVSDLLKHGAKVDAVNSAGLTALQEACCMNNEKVVELLLQHRANINKLSPAGENCLFLFLNHRPNVKNSSLLVKLLSLTSPLTIYSQSGCLPSTLMLPCFSKQREQLLRLSQQPRRLQDICKIVIYLKVPGRRNKVRKILPEKLYDFVYNSWENLHISFEMDDKQDLFHQHSGIIL